MIVVQASTNTTTTISSPTATFISRCGARTANYNTKWLSGDETAAWNVPVCNLPKWQAKSDDFAQRLAKYAIKTSGNYINNGVNTQTTKLDFPIEFGLLGKIPANWNDYSIPVYDVKEATQQVKVRLKNNYFGYNANIGGSWIESPSYNWNATVPWNPKWQPSWGNDAIVLIRDYEKGTEWFLWSVSRNDMNPQYNNSIANCYAFALSKFISYDANTDLCVAGATVVRKSDFSIADTRSYNGNSPSSGGGGIQNSAGLTLPEEVEHGEIRHALKTAISNTGFGPTCPQNLDINSPDLANTCNTAVAPAGQYERSGKKFADTPINTSIPEGTRFAINITDQEIENWLDKRGYTGRKRETARIFAVAIREYGIIITDSSDIAASIQVAGGTNLETAKKWRNLGIDDDGKSFLYQLFTEDNLYVVEPAYNKCADATISRYYCFASQTYYPTTTTTAQPTITSTVSPTASSTVSPNPDHTELSAPAQLSVVKPSWMCIFCQTTIYWSSVSGATSYEITIDGYKYRTTATNYSLWGFFYIQDPYNVSVAAIDKSGMVSKQSIHKKLR